MAMYQEKVQTTISHAKRIQWYHASFLCMHISVNHISYFRKKCFSFHYILRITADESENEVSINLYFEGQRWQFVQGTRCVVGIKMCKLRAFFNSINIPYNSIGKPFFEGQGYFFHTLYLHVSVVISDVQICKLGSSLAKNTL